MKAKDVAGELRRTYDIAARRHGYASWSEFIEELQLQNEEAGQAKAVLDDMEEGIHDSIGGRRE